MGEQAGLGHRKAARPPEVLIEKAFADSDGTYGYRRLHAQLAQWGRALHTRSSSAA